MNKQTVTRRRYPWDPPDELVRDRQRLRSLKVRVDKMESEQFDREYGGKGGIDCGIYDYVKILKLNGVQTFESCEGGPGHSYPEPTVSFHGTPSAGWRALEICFNHGLPVMDLRRVWSVTDRVDVNGAYWHVTFRTKYKKGKNSCGR